MSPEAAGLGVDFFRHGELPVPQVTNEEAERVAASFGLTVRAQPLGSQQDSNFLLVNGGSASADRGWLSRALRASDRQFASAVLRAHVSRVGSG